ncbi:hypothetical protein QBC32DRAFT_349560 [Pseudoneurospora amorphoporcata]|uniref:Uncharacterized protein n=1 Tax=Pseudoneurospora amorphoporcata TaxID=241081 RepID=A0AAN6SCJ2_9PEZI|nr:hypothetical protein QBC32DRAFT_349560 [Pseudoneurospora amorphoporcata]
MSFNSFIHCVLLLIVLSLISLSLNKVLATILGIRSRFALVRRGRRVCRIWFKQITIRGSVGLGIASLGPVTGQLCCRLHGISIWRLLYLDDDLGNRIECVSAAETPASEYWR